MTAAPVSLPQVLVMLADPILEGPYRTILQSPSYCTVWCEKGEHWKESLLSFQYHVIVVDFSLFPEGAIESLLAIKKLSPEADIIVLSESEDPRIAIEAFRNGVSDYFLKPTNPETLAWAIEKVVRRRGFYPSNTPFGADLTVFSAAHHINVAESDDKMRDLTLKHLSSVLRAATGAWAFPETEQTGLTGHPEKWVKDGRAWIPLKEKWMGGVVLEGISGPPDERQLGRAEFLVRNLENALENQRRFAEVKQLTYVDDLTGLYNSRYLEIALEAAIEEYRRTNQGFSVLFIDIDHFKKVNDGNGHLVGSQLLIDLAQLLKKNMRKPDHLFRYGGDEFIALLHGSTSKKAIEAAERLRIEAEQRKFFVHNKELKLTLSIGVATFPEHGRDKKTMIQMADNAMYAGKKQGRNTVFMADILAPKKTAA